MKHTKTSSMAQLGRELHLSREYISRAVSGCHVNLNGNLRSWVARSLSFGFFEQEITSQDVQEWYENFQYHKRIESGIKRGLVKYKSSADRHTFLTPVAEEKIPNPDAKGREFKAWRKKYWDSYRSFSTDMCCHPANVWDFEEGRLQTMPRQVVKALEVLRKRTRTSR